MNISILLTMIAEAEPDRIATGVGEDRLSSRELEAAANRLAVLLSDGDGPVAFLAENSPMFPVALFGAARSGRPISPLNYRVDDEHLNRLLHRLGEPTIIVAKEMQHRLTGAHKHRSITVDEAWAVATDEDGPEIDEFATESETPAVLLYTSGTTGDPKTVILRHEKLTNYVLGSVEFLGAPVDEAAVVVVPPYHIAGIAGVLSTTYAGRRTVQLGSFEPESWVETVRTEKITHAMVVPTMLKRILDYVEENQIDLGALRHLSYGGGPMPQNLIEHAMKMWPHISFTNAYGLTETSATISVLTPEDHREAYGSDSPELRARLSSVGRPFPHVEVEIRDESGNVVPVGVPGLLFVRGPQVAGEYKGFSAIDNDGWFNTRDRAYQDAEGFLFLAGREDDVIVRGGENTSPGEIEEVLRMHPQVADVAVFGTFDEEWGQRIEAAVVLNSSETAPNETLNSAISDELRAWVRSSLRSAKVPQKIHFRNSLPYNEMGKVVRRLLIAEYSDEAEGSGVNRTAKELARLGR